ncbi:MAG: exosortase-associated EpsI family protein [Planctomycetes bacterium]|nr:exosortase-associated EpsI family protein [Planctomycetota bacterium]
MILFGAIGAGAVRSPWAVALAAAPVVYLALATAPVAVSREPLPVARLLVALATVGVYVRVARRLGRLPQYGLCCAALGVTAGFFLLWEPPPPKPVPIARPLIGLRGDLLAQLPGWTGEHEALPASIEDVLGADAYLNLRLRSKAGPYEVQVFVTYNANAMSNIPHVPWVCMAQAGYRLAEKNEADLLHPTKKGKEIKANVILFEPGEGMAPQQALMFQYFNVGGEYQTDRQVARVMAASGAIGRRGSYLSQTQVAVYMPQMLAGNAMERTSEPYQLGVRFLDVIVPLLERDYYPDLTGTEGG